VGGVALGRERGVPAEGRAQERDGVGGHARTIAEISAAPRG
jgi:hypothetical protein